MGLERSDADREIETMKKVVDGYTKLEHVKQRVKRSIRRAEYLGPEKVLNATMSWVDLAIDSTARDHYDFGV